MVIVKNIVLKNMYRDSVQLLRISEEAKKLEGVVDAAIVMGTVLNKKLLEDQGLLTSEGAGASESDLVIALKVREGVDVGEVVRRVRELVEKPVVVEKFFYSIESALDSLGEADLALISIPGEYVREVADKLLDRGVNLHIFSDHVPLEDEVYLKKKGVEKGVLVMGPEAGTSIINGVGLGFANVVKRGFVGLVAAAGTGLQEVSSLLSNVGLGVSHGIGVGGRDLWEDVGGLSTLFSIKLLEEDSGTEIVSIISKPPSESVSRKIIDYVVSETRKKYVICFIGSSLKKWVVRDRVLVTNTLASTVIGVSKLVSEEAYRSVLNKLVPSIDSIVEVVDKELSRKNGSRGFIRGLYTGGTLAYEAQLILQDLVGPVYSNTPLNPRYKLENPWVSEENTIVDLGSEEFTKGRPHPMIDPSIRVKRIVEEAGDPGVSVLLLDFVLGYGSHPDLVGAHLDALVKARENARENGRWLSIIAHVVGTPDDPQDLERQTRLLRDHGVIVADTNVLAVLLAGFIANGVVDPSVIDDYLRKYMLV